MSALPILALAGVVAVAAAAPAPPDAPIRSPTMRALAAAGIAGVTEPIERFWARMQAAGTPLVEPAGDDPGHSLVTFLYEGGPATRRVRLASDLNALLIEGAAPDFETLGLLQHLPGSDLWYLTFHVRNDLRITYWFEVTADTLDRATTELDPHNPSTYLAGTRWAESALTLPDAPARPWRDDPAPRGRWHDLAVPSRALDGPQAVRVYTPGGYDTRRAEAYAVLVASDAVAFSVHVPADRIVEHLAGSGAIPPTVLVLVPDLAGAFDSTGYDPAATFVADELLPTVRREFRVTDDPARVALSGTSRRGLIATYVAFARPDAVGNALALSGSYYWRPPGDAEFEWLPRTVAQAPPGPARFYLAAGLLETVVTATNEGHYLLATNRHMRDVLVAKGYDLRYVEFYGVHSLFNWEDWLADGLRALW